MIEGGNYETERVRVTSSCWLSKHKIKNYVKKRKSFNKLNDMVFANFNICSTSVALPIINVKNDLKCISENKQINRLRQNKNKEMIQEINVLDDDETSSLILRSKAFNETWKLLNDYMNCFIYNYLNEMINKEVNFLNKNLCLKDDKVSLLIIKTQTCPFVNSLQYRIIAAKLKVLNCCSKKHRAGGHRVSSGRCENGRSEDGKNGRSEDGKNGRSEDGKNGRSEDGKNGMSKDGKNRRSEDGKNVSSEDDERTSSGAESTLTGDDNTFTYNNSEDRLVSYIQLKNQKHITSCMISVYSNDTVESILIRIIKELNGNCFMKVDRNNINYLFYKTIKKKRKRKKKKQSEVLLIFIKNYLQLRSSTFSALLLYLTHLKEITSINISVIITNNCVLSALSNLVYFIKKYVHVNICNFYLNYYNLIENIIFIPFFNSVLIKLKEYNYLIDRIFISDHDLGFLRLKHFFYMFIRDFYDKKILSFLNIPLTYFSCGTIHNGGNITDGHKTDGCKKEEATRGEQKEEEYTKTFSTFERDIIKALNVIDVKYIHEKYTLFLYASNFYEKHIHHLKSKGDINMLNILSELSMGNSKNLSSCRKRGRGDQEATKTAQGKRSGILNDPKEVLEDENQNRMKEIDDNAENCDMENIQANDEKQENAHVNEKNKKKRPQNNSNGLNEEHPNMLNQQILKKRKIENEHFYNCILYFSFSNYKQGKQGDSRSSIECSSKDSGTNEKIMNRKKEDYDADTSPYTLKGQADDTCTLSRNRNSNWSSEEMDNCKNGEKDIGICEGDDNIRIGNSGNNNNNRSSGNNKSNCNSNNCRNNNNGKRVNNNPINSEDNGSAFGRPHGETPTSEIIFLTQADYIRRRSKSDEHLQNYYFQNNASYNLLEGLSPINKIVDDTFIYDCKCLKQYVINNLSVHMKVEHNLDCLKILMKEWKNNEYMKIYNYEKIVAKLDTCSNTNSKNNGKGSKNLKHGNSVDKNRLNEDKKNELVNMKKMVLLYLHKCLIKSISKRMISLLYKKKKYNICLAVINIILKNIPIYSSLRKRIKILKELFKKYEQKFSVHNLKDLIIANEEIERELKQTLNTICDLLINLYITKINVLKKILNDIYNFLNNVSYVFKLEKYVNKRNRTYSISMSIFLDKLNYLITYLDVSIELKKRRKKKKEKEEEEVKEKESKHWGDAHNMANISPLNRNIYNVLSDVSSSKGISPFLHENEKVELCKTLNTLNIDAQNEKWDGSKNDKGNSVRVLKEGPDHNTMCNSEVHTSGSNNTISSNDHLSKDLLNNDRAMHNCQNSGILHPGGNYNNSKNCKDEREHENIPVSILLNKLSLDNVDLTFIEFMLVYFCEYFYFLLIPCLYLFPLTNICVTHDHSAEIFDVLNTNLQMRLLHVLYYNKLNINDINKPNICVSLNYRAFCDDINDTINSKGKFKEKQVHLNKKKFQPTKNILHITNELTDEKNEIIFFSFADTFNKCQNEDIVIIFKIVQNMKTKSINMCSMFIEYMNMKLNLVGGSEKKNNSYGNNGIIDSNSIGNGSSGSTRNSRKYCDSNTINKRNGVGELTESANYYCYTFQGLFYRFIIAIMSLFYFMKIIHIPSSFVKTKDDDIELFSSIIYDEQRSNFQNCNDIITNEHVDTQISEQGKITKLKRLDSPGNGKKEEQTRFNSLINGHHDMDATSSPFEQVKDDNECKFKNYVFDMLSNTNIRKLIFGKRYLN
ncbi:conserved Plasmodium protein, unknown function [Plasmodium malariae]|uniref:Uncharacterized protein n=1 Tax=Plasmodium malariae TaxID=5858 RepID=A0A1D3JM83_PLAMA|nr:conserved Plasmodium protein, unknown function [Plasmodium malariae]SBT87775.1 conserved Plasmodium protein, unknown function [Plasmodium malariae]